MDASFSFTLHRYGFQLSVIWDEHDNRRELPISRFDRWSVTEIGTLQQLNLGT
jgi:hypothetical protein